MSFFTDWAVPFLVEKMGDAYESSVTRVSLGKMLYFFNDNRQNTYLFAAKYAELITRFHNLPIDNDAAALTEAVSQMKLFCTEIEPINSGTNTAFLSSVALQLERAITCFYKKLKALELLDKQLDESPTAILRGCLTQYLYEKITEDYDNSLFEHAENPTISAMAMKKELLVKETLQNLSKLAAPSAKEVLEYVRELQRENTRLCEDYSVSFGLFSLQPSKGFLGIHAENAVTQITQQYPEQLRMMRA